MKRGRRSLLVVVAILWVWVFCSGFNFGPDNKFKKNEAIETLLEKQGLELDVSKDVIINKFGLSPDDTRRIFSYTLRKKYGEPDEESDGHDWTYYILHEGEYLSIYFSLQHFLESGTWKLSVNVFNCTKEVQKEILIIKEISDAL